MSRYFKYASHAQVLKEHARFTWNAVVDTSEEALSHARNEWNVPMCTSSIKDLSARLEPDLAVVSTPPGNRIELLEELPPSIRAIFVEKPLGPDLAQSMAFVEACKSRGIVLQVNYWRRGDEYFQSLAEGKLFDLIGIPYVGFGLYGNGLRNNGAHMIDFVQMLLGDIRAAEVVFPEEAFSEGPLSFDPNVSFALLLKDGPKVVFHSIPFSSYREVALDLWGSHGRLGLYQESLGILHYPRRKNRAVMEQWEISSDAFESIKPTCGQALYRMYDNLADALDFGVPLWSSGDSALKTEAILEELIGKPKKFAD